MRKRYMTIIKNSTGLEEYDIGIEQSDNIITHEFKEEEFKSLCENGIFKKLNEACGLLIDDYESEIIKKEDVKKIITDKQLITQIKNASVMFYKALKDLNEIIVAVALDF